MQRFTITLDKDYSIAYGTKALRLFEDEAGYPITQIGENIGIGTISTLIFAGVSQLASVSRDQVDNAIDAYLDSGGDIQSVMDTVGKALEASGWLSNPTIAEPSTTSATASD